MGRREEGGRERGRGEEGGGLKEGEKEGGGRERLTGEPKLCPNS